MNKRPTSAPFYVLLTLLLAVGHHQVVSFGQEDINYNPIKVVPPFDAIVTPQTVTTKQAATWVKDHELVLGVVVNNHARAYPINMLTNPTREIINDKLGGKSIAATW